jgi:hypothetical protein
MSDDEASSVGPKGEPLIGLDVRHLDARGRARDLSAASTQSTKSARQKAPAFEHRSFRPDPLDVAAQGGRGARPEKIKLEAAKPVVEVENAIVFAVVARIDGGPWNHQFVSESIRPTTYPSQRRAEGIADWLRQKSVSDGTGIEYRVIPLIGAERILA